MTQNTGGSAFPKLSQDLQYKQIKSTEGMTLRDYFAAKAMQSLLVDVSLHAEDLPSFATSSYMMADAMLKARGESK